MSRKQASLRRQIAMLERELDSSNSRPKRRASRTRRRRSTGTRKGGVYMDEESMMDEVMMDEDSMMYMDDEAMMDEEMMEEDMMFASRSRRPGRKARRKATSRRASRRPDRRRRQRASEEDPAGVEEEITQDYLSEVNEVAPGSDGSPDADLVIDVAPTTASMERLTEASARLNRLASYVEREAVKTKSKKWMKVAYRIDQFGDAIDARIRQAKENKR